MSLRQFIGSIPGVPGIYGDYLKGKRMKAFKKEFEAFVAASKESGRDFPIDWNDRYPCLSDKTSLTGFDRHYIYHPAWAARCVAKIKPAVHVDISSTLNFCAIVSAFIPVEYYEFRPANIALDQLKVGVADLTNLHFETDSIASLSCMHTIEHIGMGRYGDPVDPWGDVKAMKELIRVLKPGGDFLFVTPVGASRIQFNAHRIYSYRSVLEHFKELTLVECALVPDDITQGLLMNPSEQTFDAQRYGCGCFWFRK